MNSPGTTSDSDAHGKPKTLRAPEVLGAPVEPPLDVSMMPLQPAPILGPDGQEYVDPLEFPEWYYAQVELGEELRVVSIVHVQTANGPVPYWFEDPDYPHRALPLLRTMRPSVLGDYGSYLAMGNHMAIFIAICKAIDDLPDPLQAVQAIHWISTRQLFNEKSARMVALQGVNAVQLALRRRRSEFEQIMRLLNIPIRLDA